MPHTNTVQEQTSNSRSCNLINRFLKLCAGFCYYFFASYFLGVSKVFGHFSAKDVASYGKNNLQTLS
jgi:hypothetical protein